MGLFDFLKKKEPTPHPAQPSTGTYLGDLNKTAIVDQLVQIPHDERDDNWRQTFLDNIGQASFRCGNPQVLNGPDGMPYFQLFLPEPNTAFQCYVIERMKDDFLLTSGYGVVINPTETGADWVLSNGDIVNLHLNKTFYTTAETPFSKETESETIAEQEEVMIAQPSEAIFPGQTRRHIAGFLAVNGVKKPKILLMMRRNKNGGGVTQDLVFNLTPAHFKDEQTYRAVMQRVGWFLPRHYSYVSMDEKAVGNGFMPL